MSDSEIITISIVGELLTIDSEKAWLSFYNKNMQDLFSKFYDRKWLNRTRRNLHSIIEEIRNEPTSITCYASQPYRIVDSIPIPAANLEKHIFIKPFKTLEPPIANGSFQRV